MITFQASHVSSEVNVVAATQTIFPFQYHIIQKDRSLTKLRDSSIHVFRVVLLEHDMWVEKGEVIIFRANCTDLP